MFSLLLPRRRQNDYSRSHHATWYRPKGCFLHHHGSDTDVWERDLRRHSSGLRSDINLVSTKWTGGDIERLYADSWFIPSFVVTIFINTSLFALAPNPTSLDYRSWWRHWIVWVWVYRPRRGARYETFCTIYIFSWTNTSHHKQQSFSYEYQIVSHFLDVKVASQSSGFLQTHFHWGWLSLSG